MLLIIFVIYFPLDGSVFIRNYSYYYYFIYSNIQLLFIGSIPIIDFIFLTVFYILDDIIIVDFYFDYTEIIEQSISSNLYFSLSIISGFPTMDLVIILPF